MNKMPVVSVSVFFKTIIGTMLIYNVSQNILIYHRIYIKMKQKHEKIHSVLFIVI